MMLNAHTIPVDQALSGDKLTTRGPCQGLLPCWPLAASRPERCQGREAHNLRYVKLADVQKGDVNTGVGVGAESPLPGWLLHSSGGGLR